MTRLVIGAGNLGVPAAEMIELQRRHVPRAVQLQLLGWAKEKACMIDTADGYGCGGSEEIIDEVGGLRVCTKVGYNFYDEPNLQLCRREFSEQHLRRAVSASAHRLSRCSIDWVLLHCPSSVELRAGALARLREIVAHEIPDARVGVSLTSLSALAMQVLQGGAQLVQVPWPWAQDPVGKVLLTDLRQKGIEVWVRQVIRPPGSPVQCSVSDEESVKRLRGAFEAPLASRVVVGASSLDQLETALEQSVREPVDGLVESGGAHRLAECVVRSDSGVECQ